MKPIQHRILARLATLKEGTTMCPGRLSRDCDSTLLDLREEILTLATEGKIALSQRGKPVLPTDLHGPFRVRLKR